MAVTVEMQQLMRDESLREMETMGKRAQTVLGEPKANMSELMAEESAKEMRAMYTRAEQVGK